MEIIRLEDQFYILATSSRVDDRTRVLKHGETFAVFDRFGDMDGRLRRQRPRRLRGVLPPLPQGARESGMEGLRDSIFHEDGALATGPIALCEVQGYVYAARRGAAGIAAALGMGEMSDRLRNQAEAIQERFEETFWCEEMESYALALDGEKRPCRACWPRTRGIVSGRNRRHLPRGATGAPHGAGRHQLGVGCADAGGGAGALQPMSYHNGSVWPHDNAIIASGLARYGFKEQATAILSGLFDASLFLELNRLPELFCGFARRSGAGPTSYPVACSPQSWAAGSVFMLLQACLGLSVEGMKSRVVFDHPALPQSLEEITIRGLKVGQGSVDLLIRRYERDVGVDVLDRVGRVTVEVLE